MSLGIKAAIVLGMMIAVGVLMLVARRKNFEGVRRHYTTRRVRVPVHSTVETSRENGGPARSPDTDS